jgi:hypothetical protein
LPSIDPFAVTCADRVCMAALHQVPCQFHRAVPIKRALPQLSICRSATFGEAENRRSQGDCISKQGQEPGEVGFVPTGSLELAPE